MAYHLADSLRQVIALKDSLLAEAALRHVTVNVPPQDISVQTSRDLVDWVVNPVTSLVSAALGAVLGGVLTMIASRSAIRDQVEAERNDAVERLRRRVDRNLIRTMTVSIAARKHNPQLHFKAGLVSELKMIWESFERLSDHLGYLGARVLQDQIDRFFARVRTATDRIVAIEERLREEFAIPDSGLGKRTVVRTFLRGEAETERKAIIAELAELELEAKRLWLEVFALGDPEGAKAVDDELASELKARGVEDADITPHDAK